MAFDLNDPFPSLTLAEVLAEFKDFQREMARGKTNIGVASGDLNAQKQVQKNFKEREAMFRQSLYAKDSVAYANYASSGQNVTGVEFFGSLTEE